jgi:signal transduction histidine kinase
LTRTDAQKRAERAPIGRHTLLSIFAFWLCIPVVLGVLVLLFGDDVELADELQFLGVAIFFASLWALVTAAVFWVTAIFGWEHPKPLVRRITIVGAGAVTAAIVSLIGAAVLIAFDMRPPSGAGSGIVSVGELAARMFPSNLLIYAAIAVTGLARDASSRARLRREEAANLQAHNAQLHAQLAEARLRVLHTQLNPHFLFNTLNAVSGLMDEDPRGARRMIARLSELLRHALRDSTGQEIPLHEELALVGRYLEIVEIRFQGRLQTSVAADLEVREAFVPNLILQPLAENAMTHGVGKAGGYGRIDVSATRAGDDLLLRVLDTGPGKGVGARDHSAGSGAGLGLRHTRERLVELYGDAQHFRLERTPEGGMLAEIRIPYRTAARPTKSLEMSDA